MPRFRLPAISLRRRRGKKAGKKGPGGFEAYEAKETREREIREILEGKVSAEAEVEAEADAGAEAEAVNKGVEVEGEAGGTEEEGVDEEVSSAPPNPTRPDAAPGEPFSVCQNLDKIYKIEDIEVFALQGLDLEIKRGEVMAIIGASGSGKSTLLNVLGGLDTPTAGRAFSAGWDLLRMSRRDRIRYKRQCVGFVWQNVTRNLIPYLTALENVELPMLLNGKLDRKRAKELLAAVELDHRMYHTPRLMSGGEQQRVAIAIAMANNPSIILADEPTGSLDTRTGATVLKVFNQIRDIYGVTVVIVTHDHGIANAVDRWVEIRDGKTSSEAVRRYGDEQAVDPEESHDRYTLLDSAGRLQLPISYIETIGIKGPGRMKLTVEGRRIVIEPPDKAG